MHFVYVKVPQRRHATPDLEDLHNALQLALDQAQAGGILTNLTRGGRDMEATSYLVKVDGARFSSMVVPGDRLELEVTLTRVIRNMSMFSGVARVDGRQVACADIVCAEARS